MANLKSTDVGKIKAITSPYCQPSGSPIHHRGLFATRTISKDTEIIEYVGEKISKEEADERGQALMETSAGTDDPSVYIFILNDQYDIDGNFEYNTARLINHSCQPNCEAQIVDDEEIWIVALRTIQKGEELTFDYGFDLEHYEDHPCHCGAPKCVGYIVAKEHRPDLRELLKHKEEEERRNENNRDSKEPSPVAAKPVSSGRKRIKKKHAEARKKTKSAAKKKHQATAKTSAQKAGKKRLAKTGSRKGKVKRVPAKKKTALKKKAQPSAKKRPAKKKAPAGKKGRKRK